MGRLWMCSKLLDRDLLGFLDDFLCFWRPILGKEQKKAFRSSLEFSFQKPKQHHCFSILGPSARLENISKTWICLKKLLEKNIFGNGLE